MKERQERVKRKNRTSLTKLDLSTEIPRLVTSMLMIPTTTLDIKNAPPRTLLNPTSPSPDRVKEMILENTSVTPLPRGRSVVPAIVGERLRILDKLSREGQK